jgi:hypothetical protein
MSITQYIEDTKYMQWADGMYVMLDDLQCDYEAALVENSLRRSVYCSKESYFKINRNEDAIGIVGGDSGYWWAVDMRTKLTRNQALYIATKKTET